MAKARFLCTSKTGLETFSVSLVPDPESVSPACPECGKTTHKDFCVGEAAAAKHDPVVLEEGDTSFFQDLPDGRIELSVLTPEAAEQFAVGKITVVSFELQDG